MTKRKKISVGASQPFAALLFLLLQRFVPTPAVSYYLSQELQSLFTSTYQKVTSHPHTQLKDEEEQQPTSSTEELLSSSWAARKKADSASSTGTKVRHQQGAQQGARWSKRKQWKQWDEKVDERPCKVTSSATTDENNDYELSCVTGPGQSTRPAHDSHQLYSKIKLCNHPAQVWVDFLCQSVIKI